ncbi:MAG: DUF3179 domain-containing protein [Bacteroidales bacterium]|nr:DUF3179 domain-containing protein [Bacteroidales bacterium]
MKTQKTLALFFVAWILLTACSKEENTKNTNQPANSLESGWLVPVDELILSQLPPDRIKSIDAPYFEPLSNNNLKAGERVYVYRYGKTVKIYPERIMGGHEIVNDNIDDNYFAITFCPRTGSTIAWNREISGKVSEFGVSGHLFNENLIPYDRNNNSFWAQMRLQGIKGRHAGEQLESGILILTLGSTIKKAFPGALVLVDTSGGLKQGNEEGDPGSGDEQLSGGDFFGIAEREAILLFNYDLFDDDIGLYHTNFRNSKVIVVGSEALQFIVAFRDNTGDPGIQFSPVQNALPVVMEDNNGNRYDMTGLIVSGPSEGKRLAAPKAAFTAHSFAWELLFNSIEVFAE